MALWLDNICSTSVEPERGIPTMKMGPRDGLPQPSRARKNSSVNKDWLFSRWVVRSLGSKSVPSAEARFPSHNCRTILRKTSPLRRPSPTRSEGLPCRLFQIRCVQESFHLRGFGRCEPIGFQAGEVRIRRGQRRRDLERFAIGRDTVVVRTHAAQCVPIVEPDIGKSGILSCQFFAIRERFGMPAQNAQQRGLLFAKLLVAPILFEQRIYLLQGCSNLFLRRSMSA